LASVPPLEDLVQIGAGYQAEVFALDDERVLRLAHRRDQLEAVERESVALAAAGRAGAPVPLLYERVELDGRPGVVMERLDDEDMLFTLGHKPWRLPGIARVLGRLHAQLHSVGAPPELPSARDAVRFGLSSPLVPAEVRDQALTRLETLPEGDRLCHFDFHPANVLRGGEAYKLIDWANAARADPEADVARSMIILLAAKAPDHAPFVVRRLDPLGRRLLWSGYLRTYRRVRPLNAELVGRWRRVLAAARLAEDRPGERDWLLAEARPLSGA
jgi:aminoglycoside phosphotransferase (APT) family kinase protein